MKFLFKFPSRGRPELFKKNLSRWINHLSGENEYLFLLSFDEDDETMNNQEIKDFLNGLPVNLEYKFGKSKNKIDALNRDLENKDFDVIFPLIDDLEPVMKNFDQVIVDIFSKNSDGLDSIINFACPRWHDKLICFPVMGRKYFDRFGYIMYPEYKSLGADNDFTYVAKLLGKEIFVLKTLFIHNFIIGDETELKNRNFTNEDFEVFAKRKERNFDLGETNIKIEDLQLPY